MILSSGIIDNNNSNPVFPLGHSLPTTPGYVYLTNALETAVKFGVKAAIIDRRSQKIRILLPKVIYIFEAHIDDSIVEIDTDELGMLCPIRHSVRVPRGLILGKDVNHYLSIEEPYDTEWYSLLEQCEQDDNNNYAELLSQISATLPWQPIDISRL